MPLRQRDDCFPRPSRRGRIETDFDISHLGKQTRFPRPSRRGRIETTMKGIIPILTASFPRPHAGGGLKLTLANYGSDSRCFPPVLTPGAD